MAKLKLQNREASKLAILPFKERAETVEETPPKSFNLKLIRAWCFTVEINVKNHLHSFKCAVAFFIRAKKFNIN
jgi:hypothetical protein